MRLSSWILLLSLATVHTNPLTAGIPPSTIGYVTIPGGMDREDSSALDWLHRQNGLSVRLLNLENARLDRPGVDAIWVHIPDSVSYARWLPYIRNLKPLLKYYRGGGKMVLTDLAAMLPYAIGIESEEPEIRPTAIHDDWLWDQKGVQGFRGHPVYDGFFGGVFLWDSNVDNVVYRAGYFGNRYPREGKVVGIEKSYVVIDSDSKLMTEYASGGGRVMSVGAFVYFSRPNAKQLHLERFLGNVFTYVLTGEGSIRPTYWLPAENVPREFTVNSEPLVVSGERTLTGAPATELLLTRASPQNEFYDVAGRRALVMGRENGGIDEVWIHPFRVLRDLQAGLLAGDSVQWLKDLPVSIEVRPESFTRSYRTQAGVLKEVIFPSLERGGAIVHFEFPESAGATRLAVTFRSDLRWMWPYDERALGDVYYGCDSTLGALHVKDLSGDFYCVVGGDRRPVGTLAGRYASVGIVGGELRGVPTDANQVYHGSIYEIPAADRVLNLAIVGTDLGRDAALTDYRALLRDPAGEYRHLVAHYDTLLSTMVTIESPDEEFNRLWKWALVGVDRFLTTTPRLGTALVAGFSTVNRGWDGGHKISGRPGYAWYFGRDSEWSGFAVDDYGDCTTVRHQLEFLQKYQDISGKIFHEVSTSGVVHYDAADATPLYVILAGHYILATGDTEFLRASWGNLQKAMEFLYSTDTDGDLLIENTNVGHGWVEGGKLWPVHTEFYLAGIWGQALSDASWMASLLGKKGLAQRYARDAAFVKKSVDDEFWNASTGFYNFGKLKDGSYNPEPTVLPAPVMYFGWLSDEKALRSLTAFAGAGFTCDWGTRIVSDRSPLFNPTGYHYGSVWPLFTGWTSLAEYEYGRSAQAFPLLVDNMHIKNHWALGYVEEVLNGAVYRPSGVCPHQCWSETNILHPGIYGMIGWRPRAIEHAARLQPRFPLDWKGVTVRNLHVGSSVVDFSMLRERRSTTYRLTLRRGAPVTIDLAPEIPEGMEIIVAAVNGKGVKISDRRFRGALADPLRVRLSDSAEVRLTHAGGVGIVPLVSRPLPGDSTRGARIVSASLNGLDYSVDLEGKSGSIAVFEIVVLDQRVLSVEGASLIGERGNGRMVFSTRFSPSAEGLSRKHVVVRLQEVLR